MADEKVIIELDIKTDKALADTIALKEAVIKLTAEAKNLKETEGETSEAYVKKQAELKATQKELNVTQNVLVGLTKAEEDNTVTVQKLVAKNAELRLERDRTNIATKEGQERIKEINKEMDGNTKMIRDNADAQKDQAMNIGNYSSALGGLDDKMKMIPTSMGAVTSGFKGIIVQMWAMVANPIGATIAAIAAVFGILYALFKNFDPILDKIEQGFAALGAVISVLKDSFVGFLTGSKSLTESFGSMGTAMSNAAKEAVNLKKAQQDLEDANVALIESNAKAKQQYDELILQSKDKTKTEEERIALIDKALEVEKKAFEEKQRIAEGEYDTMLGNIKNQYQLTDEQAKNIKERGVNELRALQQTHTITDEEIKALAEASAKRYEVLQESTNLREKAINRQNALSDKFEEDEVKRLEKNKAANEKAQEDKRKAEEKAAKDKEEADKKALEDAKRIVDEKLKLLDLELREYLANNQSKLDGQNAYNDESVAIEQARLKAIYDEQQAYLQVQKDAGLISQKEFEVASLEAKNEYENQKLDLENAYKDQKLAKQLEEYQYQFDLDQEMLSQTMFGEFDAKTRGLEEQKMLESEFANKTILTVEGREKAIEKINAKYAKAEKAIKLAKFQAELGLAGDFAKNVATIAGEQSKIGKQASAAATTISTIQGSVAAFTGMTSSIPGPVGIGLGLAAAAAALASGYSNVKKILSVQSGLPGDSGGGYASGGGASTPSISATTPVQPVSVNPSLGQGIISRQVDNNSSATMKSAFSEALKENPLQPTLVTNDVTLNQQSDSQRLKTASI